MSKDETTVIATTKLNPFPVWLQIADLDDKTRRDENADGLASRDGQVLTIRIWRKLSKRDAVPVLAHEIQHILEMLEEVIDEELHGEVRAYMAGYIMEFAYEAFTSRKEYAG